MSLENVRVSGWLWGVVVTVVVAAILGTATLLSSHEVRLGMQEERIDGIKAQLSRVEDKIDRILERK